MEYRYDFYWGTEPTEVVLSSMLLLKSYFSVLDLGCGEGRNSFFISERVLNLTAVDISRDAISKINSNKKLNIITKVSDALDFMKNSENYDVIYCINLLHMLEQSKVNDLVELIKYKTNPSGFNIICSFYTEREEEKKTAISKGRYLFERDELKLMYKDWRIIHYKEGTGKGTQGKYNVELIAQNV